MAETASNVPVEGVAITAIGVAVIRARESERADRLYEDPWARAFVDAARAGFPEQRWAQLTGLAEQFYDGRTVGVRLVDDRFAAALDAGIRQIVLLGAGLDTRAFRMGIPAEATVFEIDLPEMFAFKEPVLERAGAVPTCGREVVAGDLRTDWREKLLDSGFRADIPTYWCDEGTLGYLTQSWNQRVVTTLTEISAPGSRFGTGRYITDPDNARYKELRNLVSGDAARETQQEDTEFDVERWLTEIGWDTEFRSWNEMVAPFDRAVELPDPRVGTIAAVRRG